MTYQRFLCPIGFFQPVDGHGVPVLIA